MAECDVKGKGKDLTITQGEYLDVISKNNCPKGKVLVQNAYGKRMYHKLVYYPLLVLFISSSKHAVVGLDFPI